MLTRPQRYDVPYYIFKHPFSVTCIILHKKSFISCPFKIQLMSQLVLNTKQKPMANIVANVVSSVDVTNVPEEF